MLPLIKGYGSEKVYELLAVSLQCFGGSGYCEDYPIEQYIRDQKIDSLYEGTTHIQALDLFFRKIGRDRGATLQALLGQIGKTVEALPAELGVEKAALADGARRRAGHRDGDARQARPERLSRRVPGQPDPVRARRARDRLAARGQRAGRAAARSAAPRARTRRSIAASSRRRGSTRRTSCPGIALTRKLVEAGDLDLMELPDDSW